MFSKFSFPHHLPPDHPGVLVVSDTHLKNRVLERARSVLHHQPNLAVVFLGDYVDDWGRTGDHRAYSSHLSALLQFKADFPQTVFLIGNHDTPYLTGRFEHFSAFKPSTRRLVRDSLIALDPRIAYSLHGLLFSHAGFLSVSEFQHPHLFKPLSSWLGQSESYVAAVLNSLPSDNQFWVRPETVELRADAIPVGSLQSARGIESSTILQVVGHTPVRKPRLLSAVSGAEFLLTDTFSTTSSGFPIGNGDLTLITP